IVTRNLREAKEGMGIALPVPFGHIPLIGQKRRTLSEEDRKSAQRSITQGVVFIFAFARIGKRCDRCAHRTQKICEGGRFAHRETSRKPQYLQSSAVSLDRQSSK